MKKYLNIGAVILFVVCVTLLFLQYKKSNTLQEQISGLEAESRGCNMVRDSFLQKNNDDKEFIGYLMSKINKANEFILASSGDSADFINYLVKNTETTKGSQIEGANKLGAYQAKNEQYTKEYNEWFDDYLSHMKGRGFEDRKTGINVDKGIDEYFNNK